MSEIDLETRKRRRKATNDSQSVEESDVSVESAQSDCNDNETDVEVGSGGRVEQMSASTQPRKSTFVRFFLGPNENDETAHAADDEERATVPTKNILQIFWLFTLFGLRAFGGPVAQIAMMKQELVIEQRWISVAQFNRVNSVYQALPGPEATELAVYFGVKTCGRIGGVAGGIGFIWPGFCLVLLISYLYQQYGVTAGVLASLTAMRPAVSAMFLRAIYKMSQHAFLDHASKMFQVHLLATCFLAFLASVAGVNFFITLGVCGLFNILWQQSKWSVWVWRALATLLLALCLVAYVLVVIYSGRPSQLSLGAGVVSGHNGGALFLLGLLAGLLTFGGAYTAVPYVQQDAVVIAGWLTSQAFLDALALTSVLPTPLVMFVTFVGYSGAGVSGAFLITIGMFLPAFSFPLLGHEFFERIIRVRLVAVFLDGVMSGVIGIVMVSATQLIKTAVSTPIQAAIFTLSLIVLDKFEHKLTTPLLIIFLAVAGQLLFVD